MTNRKRSDTDTDDKKELVQYIMRRRKKNAKRLLIHTANTYAKFVTPAEQETRRTHKTESREMVVVEKKAEEQVGESEANPQRILLIRILKLFVRPSSTQASILRKTKFCDAPKTMALPR